MGKIIDREHNTSLLFMEACSERHKRKCFNSFSCGTHTHIATTMSNFSYFLIINTALKSSRHTQLFVLW